jgi:predicted DNA repair protein MutK
LRPHAAEGHAADAAGLDARQAEDRKVAGAVRTDLILSAEIMAITLASVAEAPFWTRAVVLAAVGTGITAAVYGVVALIVKADDAGVALAGSGSPAARALGRALVRGMPPFLKALGAVGTAAMLWVGGGIVVHGLEGYGLAAVGRAIHAAAGAVGHALPAAVGGGAEWAVSAVGSGLLGLALGAALIPLVQRVAAPALASLRG